ncbi:hypothetical protein CLF_103667 [Clonorchis sinensis]|uniref:Uncharacterized protein n=1 Tax=Clonorchis sinensis TaxID=79923 RepID=G7YA56_CLOSI|nr:hypothetical protein CLF_103667 [Clonorchis sinensis]
MTAASCFMSQLSVCLKSTTKHSALISTVPGDVNFYRNQPPNNYSLINMIGSVTLQLEKTDNLLLKTTHGRSAPNAASTQTVVNYSPEYDSFCFNNSHFCDKVPEGFVIPNLSHRNYRKLNWGLSNLNLPRITLPSAIHRAVSMTSSQLRWRLKPVVSETDLERLTHEYRQSGALPFCHENTPFVTSRTTTFSVQQRIHKLTRSPVIFLNDKDYMQNLKYDILREQAEKCGEAFEAGDVHPQQFFPNYRPKLKKKTVPTEQLIQLISPGLPMPYVFDKDTQATPSKAEKPLRKKGSIGYFRVRGPSKSPHIGITVDTKELGGSAVDKAVNDIYLRAQESPEPVSMLMERIFPNNSQIGTLYALAEKALETAVEGSVDRYKMRSATPISKAARPYTQDTDMRAGSGNLTVSQPSSVMEAMLRNSVTAERYDGMSYELALCPHKFLMQ